MLNPAPVSERVEVGEKEDEGQPPRSRRRSSDSEEEDENEVVTPVGAADDTVEVPTGKSKEHNS